MLFYSPLVLLPAISWFSMQVTFLLKKKSHFSSKHCLYSVHSPLLINSLYLILTTKGHICKYCQNCPGCIIFGGSQVLCTCLYGARPCKPSGLFHQRPRFNATEQSAPSTIPMVYGVIERTAMSKVLHTQQQKKSFAWPWPMPIKTSSR